MDNATKKDAPNGGVAYSTTAQQRGGEGMEFADVVIIAVIFGVFNVILYVAAISLLREHEKMIDEKMKHRRHT